MTSSPSISPMMYVLLGIVCFLTTCLACDPEINPNSLCGVTSDQADRDKDGLADACDACPDTPSWPNLDSDGDGLGDVCDDDIDGDGEPNAQDVCPGFVHSGKDVADQDNDGVIDLCDVCPGDDDTKDQDKDGVSDCVDVCPAVADASQQDRDGDGVGDACDTCPDVPNATQALAACEASRPHAGLDPAGATIASIQADLITGRTTCEAIVDAHIKRIVSHDLSTTRGAVINAFTTLNDGALERARQLDALMQRTGKPQGPLHCVPVVLKDIYAVQGQSLSSGVLGMSAVRATRSGTLVRAMQAQGAVMLGMTSMDELSRGVYGISSRSGRVGNAYNPALSPGGSSAGSAAAVSSGFAVAGMGSENCGSLTLPSAYNGLTTLKPTRGYLSMSGIFPSNYLDAVPGPMTRTVGDLAQVLDAIAAPDKDDIRTDGVLRPMSFVNALSPDALKGKRIGVLRRYANNTEDAARYPWEGAGAQGHKVFHATQRRLKRLGATLVENITLPDLDIQRSFGSTPPLIRSFMPEWTDHSHTVMEQACAEERYMSASFDSPALCDAWISKIPRIGTAVYHSYLEGNGIERAAYVRDIMDIHHLDALLVPADAKGAVGSSYSATTPCRLMSVTGMPAMVFLAGYENNLPVGMMLLGRLSHDPYLVGMAYAYEHSMGPRQAPELGTADPEQALDQPFNARAFEALRLKIAERAWGEVLKDKDRWALTWQMFAQFVEDAK